MIIASLLNSLFYLAEKSSVTFITIIVYCLIFFSIGFTLRFIIYNITSIRIIDLIYNVMIGSCLVVVCFAFYKTNFQTVYILFLPLAIAFHFLAKPLKRSFNSSHLLETSLVFLIAILFVSILSTFINFNLNDQFIYPLCIDYSYNETISASLLVTGEENEFHFLNLLNTQYNGSKPYHFFEIWLNSFVIETIPVKLDGLLLTRITYPILYFVLIVLSYGILRRYLVDIKLVILLLVSLLFLTAVDVSGFVPILRNYTIVNFLQSPIGFKAYKITYYYIIFILFIDFWLQKKHNLAYTTLCLLPLFTFTSIPGIVLGLFLYVFILVILKRKQELKAHYIIFIFVFLFLFSIPAFYWLNSSGISRGGTDQSQMFSFLKKNLLNIDYLKTSFNSLMGYSLIVSLVYFFFFILFLFIPNLKAFFYKNSLLLILLLSVLFGSLLSFSMLHSKLNSDQLFLNNAFPIISISFIGIVAFILVEHKNKIIKNLVVVITLVLTVYSIAYNYKDYSTKKRNSFSKKMVSTIVKSVNTTTKDHYPFFYIRNVENLNTAYSKHQSFIHVSVLPYINSSYFSVTLDDLTIPIRQNPQYLNDRDIEALNTGILFRLAQDENYTHLNNLELADKLIEDSGLKYGFLLGEVDLSKITNFKADTLFHDSNLNHTFVRIRVKN